MTEKRTVKVEPWHKLEDILKQYGDLGEIFALGTPKMSSLDRVTVVRVLIDACIRGYRDADCAVMLQALEQADDDEHGGSDVRGLIANLYWKLPMDQRIGERSEPAFVKTRLFICRRLIKDWTPVETAKSNHAFRRLIGMGWPQPESQLQRSGEWPVEMNARGRRVSDEERRGILDIVRAHLETFVSWQATKGVDAIFAPWLKAPWVPEDLLRLLTLARAKTGGPALADRDTHFGSILDGIPESGLVVLQDVADGMKLMAKEGQEVLDGILERLRLRNPDYDARRYLVHGYTFNGIQGMNIYIRAEDKVVSSLFFADGISVIENMRSAGKLSRWHVSFVVYVDKITETEALRHRWPSRYL